MRPGAIPRGVTVAASSCANLSTAIGGAAQQDYAGTDAIHARGWERAGLRFFERVRVFPFEPVAGVPLAFAFVVFPDFVVGRRAGAAAQRFRFEDGALFVRGQLDEPGLLVAIPAIGQNDKYFALLNGHIRQTLLEDAGIYKEHLPGILKLIRKNFPLTKTRFEPTF